MCFALTEHYPSWWRYAYVTLRLSCPTKSHQISDELPCELSLQEVIHPRFLQWVFMAYLVRWHNGLHANWRKVSDNRVIVHSIHKQTNKFWNFGTFFIFYYNHNPMDSFSLEYKGTKQLFPMKVSAQRKVPFTAFTERYWQLGLSFWLAFLFDSTQPQFATLWSWQFV